MHAFSTQIYTKEESTKKPHQIAPPILVHATPEHPPGSPVGTLRPTGSRTSRHWAPARLRRRRSEAGQWPETGGHSPGLNPLTHALFYEDLPNRHLPPPGIVDMHTHRHTPKIPSPIVAQPFAMCVTAPPSPLRPPGWVVECRDGVGGLGPPSPRARRQGSRGAQESCPGSKMSQRLHPPPSPPTFTFRPVGNRAKEPRRPLIGVSFVCPALQQSSTTMRRENVRSIS